jgi:DNA-binding SARP family transcriptional activator
MATDTEFLLLGPLLIRTGSTPLALSGAKQRALLAALVLRANNVVPVDDLAEALWGADMPSQARVGVQNYVMRLRKALGAAGSRIVTHPGGYLIQVEPGELDLDRFEGLLREARMAARNGSWPEAAGHASAALALWRGEPLADVGSDLLSARDGPRLGELHLQALEIRLDADVRLGRHGEAISELRNLVAANPLRERLHGLLMLALYRDGRQAEALAAYQHARRVLVEELGTEPGPELEHLHRQVLTADAALLQPAAEVSGGLPAAAAPAPRELPGDVAAFTGRAAELAELDRLLLGTGGDAGNDRATAAVISAVSGTAGVGKTALAVHWAHHAAGQFTDGQLYVNLRGYDPDKPVAPDEALAGLLRSLGVPGRDIPQDETERAARYRSLLAGKQMLVVLDNAAAVEQVRPLLPGHPECRVVVTSRDSLAGLVARDGARRLELDPLPLTDAVALLRELIGTLVDAEPAAATELAQHCARLPLALRVAAELAVSRPATSLADLAAELRDEQRKLDLLQADGDPRTAIRAVFSWSYRHLDAEQARAFRLAGLHPGQDFDEYAVAALSQAGHELARRALEALSRAHLVQPTTSSRYAMHDLLRAYAQELASEHDGEERTRTALTGLFDYYLSAAVAAMDLLFPAEAHHRPRIPLSAASLPTASQAGAREWLDRERANLVAIVVHCAGHGWYLHTSGLAGTLFRYMLNGSHLVEARTIYSQALQAARWSGDQAAEAEAQNGLGGIGFVTGRFREAAGHYQAALEHYRRCGDRAGEARVLANLAVTEVNSHNPRSAVGYHRQAIAAFEDVGDALLAARALVNLAAAEQQLGSYDQAAEHIQRALPVLRDANDPVGEADALVRLGDLSLRVGQLTQAADSCEQALAISRRIANPVGVATGLLGLGQVGLARGQYQQAATYLRQALTLYSQAAYKHGEVLTLRSLAEALHGGGQPADARAQLAEAIRLSGETGNTYHQASAHRELAESHHSSGQHEQARYHWQQALVLYTELGAPEADEVRAQLAALDNGERDNA